MTPEKIKYQGALYVLAEEKTEKKKRMVIMVGGPASGKGFFLGEPEKWSKKDFEEGNCKKEDIGKTKPGTGYGTGLPKNLDSYFKKEDVEKVDYDESDRHLRAVQYAAAKDHFKALVAAKKEGPKAFEKALADHWYNTKDGQRRNLAKFGPDGATTHDNFPDDFDKFFDSVKPFYESMRAWHDESGTIDKDGKFHPKMNEKTGKMNEPFKDEARESFDVAIKDRLADKTKDGTVIVDSAGEDIDVQDFHGQIAAAKQNGYEVAVVFLDMDKDDAELSNMARGFINKKRMVDQQDIDNFWKVKDEQIEKIKKALPTQFIHLKREPPLSKEEREKIKKSMQYVNGKPTFLVDPDSPIKNIDDVEKAGGSPSDVKGTVKLLYKPVYRPGKKSDKEESKAEPKSKKEDKDLSPDEYHKEHGKCPAGYHWNGKKCVEADEQKKAAQLAAKIAAVAYQIRNDRNAERKAMSDTLEKMVSQAAEVIKKGVPSKIRGYPVTVFTKKKAIDVFVKVEGGAGDVTALKQLRSSLDDAASKMDKELGKGWRHKIVAHNVEEDMIVTVELHAP